MVHSEGYLNYKVYIISFKRRVVLINTFHFMCVVEHGVSTRSSGLISPGRTIPSIDAAYAGEGGGERGRLDV